MGAIVPVTTIGTAGVLPDQRYVYGGPIAITETYLTNGERMGPGGNTLAGVASVVEPFTDRGTCALVIHYFSTSATTDTWAHPYKGALVSVAWQADNADDANPMNVSLTSDTTVTWTGTSGTGAAGWVWCLVRTDGVLAAGSVPREVS